MNKLMLERHDNGIAALLINRPDSMNALCLEMMDEFAEIIAQLNRDDDLRVLILTGAGHAAFCSGGDLAQLSERRSAEDAHKMITVMGNALLALEQLPVPVIAAINGYALGGGSELALACDMRVVDENVRFGLTQIQLALTPGWGAGQRLLRLVGYSKAMEILVSGKLMSASEMVSLGLANQVTEAGMALPKAVEFANEIVGFEPAVVRSIKQLLQAGRYYPYQEALAIEREIFPPLWAAKPHLEAVEKFLQRQAKK